MHELDSMYPEDKTKCYELLQSQLTALLENEPYIIPNLSNASALLAGALKNINWVGFYLMKNGELLLGPFQGKPACVHIAVGRGVCGNAVAKNETLVVPDVHAFPGHIACDSASRSEIVVPIRANGTVVGVLDIDSPDLARFDQQDQLGLEKFVQILEQSCNWEN